MGRILVSDYTLKKHIAGEVFFRYYRKGNLWYECSNTGYTFPVPIDDCGDGTFRAEDKAILFMRYIRKQMAAA